MQALEDGLTLEEVHEFTKIDPWFLAQMGELHQAELWLKSKSLLELRPEDWLQVKKRGFSDIQIARCTGAGTHCLESRPGLAGLHLPHPRPECLSALRLHALGSS